LTFKFQLTLSSNSSTDRPIYIVFQKGSPTLLTVTWRKIIRSKKMGYEYSWHNWPSNDRSSSHITQCVLLHYLGKTERTK